MDSYIYILLNLLADAAMYLLFLSKKIINSIKENL